jgi:outer membrane receptor protein involved in Fe transport
VANGTNPSFQPFEPNGSFSNVPFDSFELFGDIVKIRGNHSTKAGVDLREYRAASQAEGNANGAYTFQSSSVNSSPTAAQIAQSWTNGPLNNAARLPGADLAAFLMGLPSSGSIDKNARTSTKERYYAFFVQDDWRVRSNLTINMGLRFEHETPTIERHNQAVNGFDPTAVNPVSALAAAAYAANPIP